MRNILLSSTVLAGALIATTAFAQDLPAQTTSPSDASATQLDEIIVTGSRIRRSAANAPTPLIQVSQDEILSTGQTSVIDYLATIPALQNSTVPSDTTGSSLNTGGLSLPNLRSLGAGRTLTLVDGRRHVGSSGGELSVDVDTIPRLLIQNVEIITGGASSVYGADAVSGVVNFILKKDFEGLEIDANYGQINSNGEASRRISGLIGKNFFDDRLNVYAHAEYEKIDNVDSMDINWIRRAPIRLAIDADPTTAPYDGRLDATVFYGVNRLDILPWGQTTLANLQQPSNLTNPNIPYQNCFSGGNFTYAANCYGVTPGKTYVYDGANGRLANFGQRVGNVGINRPYNIGGDGMPLGEVAGYSRVPASESQRYQVGTNFKITDAISFYAEAKYVTEDTFMRGQRTFFDVDLDNDSYGANDTNSIWGTSAFDLRWDDNAFLPQNLKTAIAANRIDIYAPPTAANAGQLISSQALPIARHSFFGPDRTQSNTRDIQRYVAGFKGDHGPMGFAKSLSWDLGYTYGKAEIENIERAVDSQRMALAADSVIDRLGVAGPAGSIVCRSKLLQAQGATFIADKHRRDANGDPTNLLDTEYGRNSIAQCAPLNIFGAGNQSAEALQYVDAAVVVKEMNEQQQAVGSISTELWDLWGAGNLGFAFGGEWRKETTSAIGRSASAGDRLLFLNTGADFPEVSYESKEVFTELSVPLFRDSRLGEYAELSGSYRWADYSTVGNVDVYGVNLVYRPIRDITFKTSFNSSVRVPNLGENYAPFGQTFANNFVDPCATASIAGVNDQETKANRIKNCTALAAQKGLTFDFAGATATNTDDFRPDYTSGIAGVSGGNPNLEPEESESFTFSTVLQPRFIPGLTMTLDYYEIRIDKVIASVSAEGIANNCVNGAELNLDACNSIFRNSPNIPFGVGAPSGNAIGGFIERSFNYAALETRGLDFGANYTLETADFGKNWGAFDWRVNGSWLIEQKQYLNESDPSDYDELAGSIGLSGTNVYPRVRLSSSLAWRPNDTWNINWTADWQSSANIIRARDFINNADARLVDQMETGPFVRHDLTVRYKVRDDLTLRAGVVNLFDAEQRDILGTTIYSNYDPYGRRFFVGLNFRPF
ncbi:TonB-dependent receptor domain-containing protein [Brevundimonas sp.]|jgi:outer membrane receptor protein involved in Fe transport|uniref:TonB-dependent receptor domain-containing protein n=1 Tax=Brevundimonas sp. TaxID=1871086 RepID=UPI0028A8FEF2|nr:TonB-dependent receptor [Brevundimonas sp.]